MNIEVKIDESYTTPKILIYTNKIDTDLSNIIDTLSNNTYKKLKVYKDDKIYLLDQNDIETIYSENGKIYIRANQELYTVKNRLYELASLLDNKTFVRISNSEIVNCNKIKNIDFKLIGHTYLKFQKWQ